MRRLFTFFTILLAALSAYGQTVTDTVVLENGRFKAVKIASVETQAMDSAQYFNYSVQAIAQEAQRLNNDVLIVNRYNQDVNRLIQTANTVEKAVGRNPLDSMGRAPDRLRLGTQTVNFRYNASKQWQWRADTSSQWRRCFFLGSIIRLSALNGSNVDFYKDGEQWITQGRFFTLRVPGASVRQASVPTEPETSPLNKDGTVTWNNQKWRWNTRSKTWVKLN